MHRKKTQFTMVQEQYTREHSRLSRRTFLKGMGFACLSLAPFLHACDIISGERQEGKTMAQAEPNPVSHAAIPSIDASVPSKTETATFALG